MQPHLITSTEQLKRCSLCRHVFPATTEYFYRGAKYWDGLDCWCKQCNNARKKRWAAQNLEKVREYKLRWRMGNPEYNLRYRDLHARRLRTHRLKFYRENRIALLEHRRSMPRPKNDPARLRAAKVRRRARERGFADSYVGQDWRAALDHFGGCCATCGRPPGLWHTLAMDHWIPLIDPDCPGTVPANIIPLCHGIDGCNNSKGSRDAKDWLISKFGPAKAARILERIDAYFASIT